MLQLFRKPASFKQHVHDGALVRSVESVNTIIGELKTYSDARLQTFAFELSEEVRGAPPIDRPDVLHPALALASEAIHRHTSLRMHDVQLEGALVAASGCIAEMQTGEGKTLVTIATAFMQSLPRRGVHVATTNAYLAERDYEKAAPVIERLGFSIGCLSDEAKPAAARRAYQCDVTYGTGYQFGFDYLRDQCELRDQSNRPLGTSVAQTINGFGEQEFRQRAFAMALIDEVDSVLIDEATVPLVLSGRLPGATASPAYHLAKACASELVEGEDYTVEPEQPIRLSMPARVRIHSWLRGRAVPALIRPWTKYVENALHARHRLNRDQHYVIQDDEVRIVDQNTGRIFVDRSWRDGLHQAVEAEEGTDIRPDDISSSRITRQRFYQLYDRVAGLTGTGYEGEAELKHFYKVDVIRIEQNVPSQRVAIKPRFFASSKARDSAIATSTRELHNARRPVLIGTTTIEHSLRLSKLLTELSVPHEVLNGLQDADEAGIIENAGQAGAVLVATNMAGRGTDIKPCPEALKLGGLHVIASEYAESRRVDRQLAGRAGRQGDPGSVQFFASSEDSLFRQAPSIAGRMAAAGDESGECQRDFESEVFRLQEQIEEQNFEDRKAAVRSDAWFDDIRSAMNRES